MLFTQGSCSMGKVVKKIFGGGEKPDTSALRAQEKKVAEQEAELERQEREKKKAASAKDRALRGRNAGRQSLLSGLETGVAPTEQKRGTLG